MKKKQLKNLLPFLLLVAIILVVVIIFFLIGDKKLDIEDKEVAELYSYLGEVDIYRCGGLQVYNGKETTTLNDLDNSLALCNAYYNINDKIDTKKAQSTGKDSSKNKVCKVGDNLTFITQENSDNCVYKTITKETLNKAYDLVYGNNIDKYIDKFAISNSEACYLEGETYICGNTGTYTYSIGTDATVYRLMNKAIKTYNERIIISDYYLRIADNVCYGSSENDNEIKECSDELKNIEKVDAKFITKYGKLYKHTFEKNSDNSYFWKKTETTK